MLFIIFFVTFESDTNCEEKFAKAVRYSWISDREQRRNIEAKNLDCHCSEPSL